MKTMKKLILLTIVGLLSLNVIGQNKFGYIDSQELLLLMPEREKALKEVESLEKSLQSQLTLMGEEYQQILQDYQANEATYTDLVKQDKQAEIVGLEGRIQNFQQNAQQSLQAKHQELFEPILKKVNKAIEDVATEGNFTYIFEKSTTIYAKESENVLPLVKKKLGL